MISSDIVNEIAHLIRQRDVTLKDPKEVKEIKAKTGISAHKDAVELSKAAEAYAHPAASTTEFEKEQGMKVERLKSLVGAGNYHLDPHMVESIAEKIANMLL